MSSGYWCKNYNEKENDEKPPRRNIQEEYNRYKEKNIADYGWKRSSLWSGNAL